MLTELADTINSMSAANELIREEHLATIAMHEKLCRYEYLATLEIIATALANKLNAPLNNLKGNANYIEMSSISSLDAIHSARSVREDAEIISNIIQQFLVFTRQPKPIVYPNDISVLTSQVINKLQLMANHQDVKIKITEHGDLPLVDVDPEQIKHVLENLIINGIQAMPGGGRLEVNLQVQKRTSELGHLKKLYIVIQVKDEGIGIIADKIEYIFDPFITTTETNHGIGLGLTIANGIVQKHKGWIEVQSEINAGSCFSVYIPIEG